MSAYGMQENRESFDPPEAAVPTFVEDEWRQEVYMQDFERLCHRLGELGIDDKNRHLFSTYHNDTTVRVCALSASLSLPTAIEAVETTGQRIIVNQIYESDGGEGRHAMAYDAVMSKDARSIMLLQSKIRCNQRGSWQLTAATGPFLLYRANALRVQVGQQYTDEHYKRTHLRKYNIMAVGTMLQYLNLLNPALRDEFTSFSYKNQQ